MNAEVFLARDNIKVFHGASPPLASNALFRLTAYWSHQSSYFLPSVFPFRAYSSAHKSKKFSLGLLGTPNARCIIHVIKIAFFVKESLIGFLTIQFPTNYYFLSFPFFLNANTRCFMINANLISGLWKQVPAHWKHYFVPQEKHVYWCCIATVFMISNAASNLIRVTLYAADNLSLLSH